MEGFGISVSYGRLREACQTDVDGTSIDTLEDVAVQLYAFDLLHFDGLDLRGLPLLDRKAGDYVLLSLFDPDGHFYEMNQLVSSVAEMMSNPYPELADTAERVRGLEDRRCGRPVARQSREQERRRDPDHGRATAGEPGRDPDRHRVLGTGCGPQPDGARRQQRQPGRVRSDRRLEGRDGRLGAGDLPERRFDRLPPDLLEGQRQPRGS